MNVETLPVTVMVSGLTVRVSPLARVRVGLSHEGLLQVTGQVRGTRRVQSVEEDFESRRDRATSVNNKWQMLIFI